MPRTATLVAAALLVAGGLASFTPPGGADGATCAGFTLVEAQGPSCPTEGGWLVLFPDGTSAETHGPDSLTVAARSGVTGGGNGGRSAPLCVNDPTRQFHNVLVYAVAADKADRGAEMAPVLRDMAAQANALLRQESLDAAGIAGRYKFRCDGPHSLTVLSVRLPRPDAELTFATIVGDLRAAGVNSPYAKHWVWYDGTREGLYGQATIRFNDALTSANGNTRGNDFAVVYGMLDPVYLMHENAHNMGAVQRTAPHSTGMGHCADGLDVMCYQDGSGGYDPGVCTDRVHFDCGHDDYFHPSPPAGSWLATHWNLAHPFNHFLDFGRSNMAPAVAAVTCVPAVVDYDEPTTCRVYVDDDSDGIWQTIRIDEGPTVRHPATGVQIPGVPVTLTLSWSQHGPHTITVVPTDDAKKPLTGPAFTGTVRVGCALDRSGETNIAASPEGSVVEQAIPRACSGAPFSLQATSLGADFDLCWLGPADADLGCFQALGDESGTIPGGATSARVYLKAGAAASYNLKGW